MKHWLAYHNIITTIKLTILQTDHPPRHSCLEVTNILAISFLTYQQENLTLHYNICKI